MLNARLSVVGPLALIAVVLAFLVAAPEDGALAGNGQGAGAGAVWADWDCNGDADSVDSLQGLRFLANLGVIQTPPCQEFGTEVEVQFGAESRSLKWGDFDCDGAVNSLDALKVLQEVAGLATVQTPPCPAFRAAIVIGSLVGELVIEDDWRDYGDAPDGTPTSYLSGAATGDFPTTPGNAGPQHPWPFGPWLGESATQEPEPRVGDDSADDGLLETELVACDTSSLLLMLNVSAIPEAQRGDPVFLNILADWDQDGRWEGADACADEWAVQNAPLDIGGLGAGGLDVIAVEFPGGAQVSEFWLRVTLTREQYDPAAGGTLAGETEDYLVKDGEIFVSASQAFVAKVASPSLNPDGIESQFPCVGAMFEHGDGAQVTFIIEQTQASHTSGFRVAAVNANISSPRLADGSPAGAAASSAVREFKREDAVDGRARFLLALTINTQGDDPDRIEGLFRIFVNISGESNQGPFDASVDCAFYVDHGPLFDRRQPALDGFRGGPGRDPGTFGAVQIGDKKFVFVPHDKKLKLLTDANVTDQQSRNSAYVKATLTVFDSSGVPLETSQWDMVGIKDVRVPDGGRGLILEPIKDSRTPVVQVVFIRIAGKTSKNEVDIKFVDYYRVFIVHENNDQKAIRLLDKYINDLGDDIALQYFDESDAIPVSYSDGGAVHSRIPPDEILFFEEEDDVCTLTAAAAGAGGGTAVDGLTVRPSGTLNDFVRSPMRAPDGSHAVIIDWGDGGSDIIQLPPPNGVVPRCDGGTNLTGFGPGSTFTLERGNSCGDAFVFAEFPTFRIGAAKTDGSGPFPIPGGDSHRYPNCYDDPTNGYGVIASAPGNENKSNLKVLPVDSICGPCMQFLSAQSSMLLIEADVPDSHLITAVISPDLSMIAYERDVFGPGGLEDAQVFVADFNAQTKAASNIRQLTSDGFNGVPAWSPGSDRIAFVSNRDGDLEIYVMDADGGNQMNLTNSPTTSEFDASWQNP